MKEITLLNMDNIEKTAETLTNIFVDETIKQLKIAFPNGTMCPYCKSSIDLENPPVKVLIALATQELFCSREHYENHYQGSDDIALVTMVIKMGKADPTRGIPEDYSEVPFSISRRFPYSHCRNCDHRILWFSVQLVSKEYLTPLFPKITFTQVGHESSPCFCPYCGKKTLYINNDRTKEE